MSNLKKKKIKNVLVFKRFNGLLVGPLQILFKKNTIFLSFIKALKHSFARL